MQTGSYLIKLSSQRNAIVGVHGRLPGDTWSAAAHCVGSHNASVRFIFDHSELRHGRGFFERDGFVLGQRRFAPDATIRKVVARAGCGAIHNRACRDRQRRPLITRVTLTTVRRHRGIVLFRRRPHALSQPAIFEVTRLAGADWRRS